MSTSDEKLKELDLYISRLEREESSYPAYAKLADLYTVRDHMLGDSQREPYIAAYSEAAAPQRESMAYYGDSDFLQSAAGKPSEDVWRVMDELMDTLRVTNAKMYESVMRKLNRI